jgi:hypothetical protein
MTEDPEDETIEELDEPLAPLTPEHRGRVLKALDTIEEAQRKLYDAAELLCPVPGLSEEWDGVRAEAYAVKKRWYAVEAALRMLDAPNR